MPPRLPDPATSAVQTFRTLTANERAVLGLIRRHAPISRAELARRTGLALPSVSRITEALMAEGLVAAEEKMMMGRMGQPSLPLVLAPHAAYAVGAAIRADSLTVTLSYLSGAVVDALHEDVCDPSRSAVENRIIALMFDLVDAHGVQGRLCGIGIALSGFFLDGQDRINAPLGMEDWAAAQLETRLHERMGVPVTIENDGSAAAMGEYFLSGADDAAHFAYLYIDRGLGGGLVVDGRLQRGSHGNAGEFTGLLPPEARARRPTLELLRAMLAEDGRAFATIADMVAGYDPAWPTLERWLKTVAPATDAMVSAIASILDPHEIVIGGRIPPNLADRLARRAACYSVPVRGKDRPFPHIRAHTAQSDATAFGASMLCFKRYML